MSRELIIVRHAKSCWDDPLLTDLERPLTKRGRRAAKEMARRLQQAGFSAPLLLSSPAVRALETAERLCSCWPKADLQIEPKLYGYGEDGWLHILRELGEHKRVAMVGHNPELARVVATLSGIPLTHLPTAGVAVLRFDTPWDEVGADHPASWCWFDTPSQNLASLFREPSNHDQ